MITLVRAAVPFRGQNISIWGDSSPKRNCSTKRVHGLEYWKYRLWAIIRAALTGLTQWTQKRPFLPAVATVVPHIHIPVRKQCQSNRQRREEPKSCPTKLTTQTLGRHSQWYLPAFDALQRRNKRTKTHTICSSCNLLLVCSNHSVWEAVNSFEMRMII